MIYFTMSFSPFAASTFREHINSTLMSKQELFHGCEDSQSVRHVLVVNVVIPGVAIHQTPHAIVSGDHDPVAPQDVRRIHCHFPKDQVRQFPA